MRTRSLLWPKNTQILLILEVVLTPRLIFSGQSSEIERIGLRAISPKPPQFNGRCPSSNTLINLQMGCFALYNETNIKTQKHFQNYKPFQRIPVRHAVRRNPIVCIHKKMGLYSDSRHSLPIDFCIVLTVDF